MRKFVLEYVFVRYFDGCGVWDKNEGGLITAVASVRQKPHGKCVHEQSHSIRREGPHKGCVKATKEDHRPFLLVAPLCTVNDPSVLELSLLRRWIKKKEKKIQQRKRNKEKKRKERKEKGTN